MTQMYEQQRFQVEIGFKLGEAGNALHFVYAWSPEEALDEAKRLHLAGYEYAVKPMPLR